MTVERTSSLARLFAVEPENDWRMNAACKGLDPEQLMALHGRTVMR